MGGVVVRAVGGRRDEYRPIRSKLTPSTEPTDVARALVNLTGATECYVADLDAIMQGARNVDLYRRLTALGCELWLDAGVRTADDAEPLTGLTPCSIVLGSETIRSPQEAEQCVVRWGTERFVVSIDLREGTQIGNAYRFGILTPGNWPRFAAQIAQLGVRRAIVLDLADVGTARGPSTGPICAAIKAARPE